MTHVTGSRRQASVYGVAGMLCLALWFAGCSSAPKYPEPAADSGQILVQLDGKPRRGVKAANRESAGDEYSNRRVSVEAGKAFERVDYDSIEDVVVIVKHSAPGLKLSEPRSDGLEVNDDGFSRMHLLMQPGGSFRVQNTRATPLTLVGVSLDEIFEVRVNAGSSAEVKVPKAGEYEISCDEDETLFAFLFVTDELAWIGNSEKDAFFDRVMPGDYALSVHAPRLPCWYGKIKVSAGKRLTETAELTVNILPEK